MDQPRRNSEEDAPRAGSKVIQFQVIDRMLYILMDDGTMWKRSAVLDPSAENNSPWHKLVTIGGE